MLGLTEVVWVLRNVTGRAMNLEVIGETKAIPCYELAKRIPELTIKNNSATLKIVFENFVLEEKVRIRFLIE